MKKRTSLIKLIKLWGVIFLMGFGVSIVVIDVIDSHRDFNFRADQMRTDYIAFQKQIIKQEVNRVVDLISYEKAQSEILTKGKIKSRVYEAYSIAQNIYQQNKTSKSEPEIQQMILDALRPIRFENGSGYYFVTRLDGVEMLFADKPKMESLNLLELQDTRGQYVVKDMINIAQQAGEGFYEYLWTKPNSAGNEFKKISFVKRFEPYDWFVGTGLYIDDVEAQIKATLLSTISRIRFDKEGYIFINRLNGDALVSNGQLFPGTKKLWEVFNDNPDKMKAIFNKEYNAALKPEGDYIYYAHIKLTAPNIESPKVSFIYGIPDLQWLVGAGVYLDDVETDIALMRTKLNQQLKERMLYDILTVMGTVALFFLFFNWLNRWIRNDFNLFSSFFNRATRSDKEIDRNAFKFIELDHLAEYANKMLTERKRAEKALRKSEEKYKLITETSQTGIYIHQNNIIIYANYRFAELHGYTVDELIGANYFDLFYPDERERALGIQAKRLRDDEDAPQYHETKRVRKDGGLLWCQTVAVRIEYQGKPAIMGNIIDITERKLAEKQRDDFVLKLQDALVKVETLSAISQTVNRTLELDQMLTDALKKTMEVLKVEAGMIRLLDETTQELVLTVHKGFSRQQLEAINIRRKSGEGLSWQVAREGKTKIRGSLESPLPFDGKRAEFSSSPLTFRKKAGFSISANIPLKSKGRMMGTMSIFRKAPHEIIPGEVDLFSGIGNQIGTAIENARLYKDKEMTIKDLKDTQAQLQQAQKMESIGTLAGGIAHDFNNILGIIIGNTELALDDIPEWNAAHSNLEAIKTASLRATNIVRQLLSFSRKTDQKLQPIEIALVIKDAIRFLRSTIPTSIDIRQNIPVTDEVILADPTQINQIMMNLCINASHAMEQTGGILTIHVENVILDEDSANNYPDLSPGNYVQITVSDTGPGIDPNIINRIFDPYFTTKEVGKGSGMGLAVVLGIVKSHSGALFVDSKPGEGATFKIFFPLAERKTAAETETIRALPGGSETVLFVDDEIMIVEMARKLLERLGYRVEPAMTPGNALELFSANPDHFDLVITDMTMPQMSGVKLSEKLRDIRPDIPIIICTGHSDLVDEEKAKELGLAAYVMKPISMREIAITIRNVFDKKQE